MLRTASTRFVSNKKEIVKTLEEMWQRRALVPAVSGVKCAVRSRIFSLFSYRTASLTDHGYLGSSEMCVGQRSTPRRVFSSSSLAEEIPCTEPIGIKKTAEDMKCFHTENGKVSGIGTNTAFRKYPIDRIRNFSIIAHIDHGKTTLSDSILRRTKVLPDGEVGTYTDKLQVEKDRGITVKSQSCTMFIKAPPKEGEAEEEFMLNLIDTPGHVDFSYEVKRSLRSSDAAILLVDVNQGIQAQTMANMYNAMECDLKIIPVLTKLDASVDTSAIDRCLSQLEETLGIDRSEVQLTAARSFKGIEALLRTIVTTAPPPKNDRADEPVRAFVFDAFSTIVVKAPKPGMQEVPVRSVVCMIRMFDGSLRKGDKVFFFHQGRKKIYEVKATGIMYPQAISLPILSAGQVGFVDLGISDKSDAQIGDTLCHVAASEDVAPIAPFAPPRPVVFAGFFPESDDLFGQLSDAVSALRINDPDVSLSELKCPAFGHGLQLGFLGTLHLSVFQQRLQSEHDCTVLVTPAQVFYKYRDTGGVEHPLTVSNWKAKHEGVSAYLEPIVHVTLITPQQQYGELNSEAIEFFRGEQTDLNTIDGTRLVVRYKMPFAELIRGFFDRIKSISHGYAGIEYDEPVYEESDLVKIEVHVNQVQLPALDTICLQRDQHQVGKRLVTALQERLKRNIFEMPIQAKVGGKIVARGTVKAKRKDVTAKCHAGDMSRTQRKLDHQKKGKARAAEKLVGKGVVVDQETLAAVIGAQMS